MTGAEPQPFRIDIDQRELDALRQRLHAMRWPDAETVDDWSQGVPLAYCRELAAHWADAYDWRRCEQRLNGWPNFLAALPLGGQSHDIHFIHRRSSNPDARPLLITHGWPGAVLEFCTADARRMPFTWSFPHCQAMAFPLNPAAPAPAWRPSPTCGQR